MSEDNAQWIRESQ
jgi:hypothetical protein